LQKITKAAKLQKVAKVANYTDRFVELGALRKVADDLLESAAGLRYRMGGGQNRVAHVLRHGAAIPGNTKHTVFNVPRDKILSKVDEAWAKRSPAHSVPRTDGRLEYKIPMGATVGTNGEQNITIVVEMVDGAPEIITAYPKI
jgi:hypothetical protein